MGQNDHFGRHFVIIELANKRLDHFGLFDIFGDPRIEILVAPVLVRSDKKDLHTGLPPFHMKGNDIGFAYCARVDPLVRLHRSQRANTVAQGSGPFKFHILSGLGHIGGQRLLQLS